MRPVNLIPPDERRGEHAPLRQGSLSYLIVAALAVALIGVVVTVTTQNSIAEQKTEVATLEAREAEARARAESLAAFAEFTGVAEARNATVSSLAQSRFDWYRVLRELSLVIPEDVALTSLDGTVSGEAAAGDGATLDAGSQGPSLALSGCATGHEAVAGFLEDLKDIDGVTRVGAKNSTLGEDDGTSGAASASEAEGACGAGEAQFLVVAVFDGVAPAAAAATAPVPAPAAPASSEATAITDPAVADAQAQEQESRDSITEQSEKSRNATNLIPGVAR